MKTKLSLTRLGITYGELKFDEKSIFKTSFGFTNYWQYKPTEADDVDSLGVILLLAVY